MPQALQDLDEVLNDRTLGVHLNGVTKLLNVFKSLTLSESLCVVIQEVEVVDGKPVQNNPLFRLCSCIQKKHRKLLSRPFTLNPRQLMRLQKHAENI